VSEPCAIALHWQVKAIAGIIQKFILDLSCSPSKDFIPVRETTKPLYHVEMFSEDWVKLVAGVVGGQLVGNILPQLYAELLVVNILRMRQD